jgi:hypothetical protein
MSLRLFSSLFYVLSLSLWSYVSVGDTKMFLWFLILQKNELCNVVMLYSFECMHNFYDLFVFFTMKTSTRNIIEYNGLTFQFHISPKKRKRKSKKRKEKQSKFCCDEVAVVLKTLSNWSWIEYEIEICELCLSLESVEWRTVLFSRRSHILLVVGFL